MKLLFVHEGERIKEDSNGNLYTGGSYNEKVWERYINICSSLSVIMRKDPNKYKPNYAKSKFNFFNKEKIKFIKIPDLTTSISSYINPRERVKTRSIIEEAVLKHDMIIARLPSDSGNIAIALAKKYNKPYLVEVVGCPWDALWNHSYKGKVLAFGKYLKMKKAVLDAPYAVYVTNNFLQKRYPTKGKSTNCSNVTLTEFDDLVLEKRLKKIDESINGDKLILGTTAAVDVRYKGQQYIIQALGVLKKKGITNFEYQLLGGGNQTYLKSVVEKYDVKSQVKFLGPLPHKEVFKWLETIDIYVQPSKQEGLPRALIEAMSLGLPAFGSNTAGIPELLENSYIFSKKRNNINEICEILQSFTKDVMISQAKRNFNESKKYDKELIDGRRNKFFFDFKESAKEY